MNTVTITGNLTREPEIRYTREGQATAQLGVAVNRRWQDRTTQEWQETTSFFDIVCWRDLAENVALSLTKGMRVVVTGRLEQRSWETDEGEHRSKVEITADEIGPSLRFATADVQRTERPSALRPRPTRSRPSSPSERAGGAIPRPLRRGTGATRLTHLLVTAHDGVIGAKRCSSRGVDRRRSASSGRCGAPPRWQPAPPSPRQLGSATGLRFLARARPPLDPDRTARSFRSQRSKEGPCSAPGAGRDDQEDSHDRSHHRQPVERHRPRLQDGQPDRGHRRHSPPHHGPGNRPRPRPRSWTGPGCSPSARWSPPPAPSVLWWQKEQTPLACSPATAQATGALCAPMTTTPTTRPSAAGSASSAPTTSGSTRLWIITDAETDGPVGPLGRAPPLRHDPPAALEY